MIREWKTNPIEGQSWIFTIRSLASPPMWGWRITLVPLCSSFPSLRSGGGWGSGFTPVLDIYGDGRIIECKGENHSIEAVGGCGGVTNPIERPSSFLLLYRGEQDRRPSCKKKNHSIEIVATGGGARSDTGVENQPHSGAKLDLHHYIIRQLTYVAEM